MVYEKVVYLGSNLYDKLKEKSVRISLYNKVFKLVQIRKISLEKVQLVQINHDYPIT